MQINRAILEIFDFNSSMAAYSDKELDLGDQDIQDYLASHVAKALKDPGLRTGQLHTQGKMADRVRTYVEGNISFLDFSNVLAESIFDYMKQSTEPSIIDLIVCDVQGESRYICALLCQAHAAYTHVRRAGDDGKTGAELVLYQAMLPMTTQKIRAFMSINVNDLSVRVFEPKGEYDGESTYILADKILQIGTNQSTRDTVKKVKKIVDKVSQVHESDGVAALAMTRTMIAQNAEVSDTLDPVRIVEKVFADNPIQQEAAKKELAEQDMLRPLPVAREFASKEGVHQKIKTDTGIEITFPVEYMKDKEFIEILTNDDGTLRIELKNINKIMNK